MSAFDIDASVERARKRLGASSRPHRADKGAIRLASEVLDCVQEVLGGQEKPRIKDALEDLARRCRARGHEPPSRATLYKLMTTLPGPRLRKSQLPGPVQEALYNLGAESEVPMHQVAFYCFNYGDLAAVSFASGMPWLAIFQALRLRGYRGKSRGLIEAVAQARGIRDEGA